MKGFVVKKNHHVVMVVSNPFLPDPRVYREARALVENGLSVTIICWDRDVNHLPIEDYDGIHMTSSAISTGIIEALFQGTGDFHPFYYDNYDNTIDLDIDVRRCDPLTVLINPYKK